MATATAAAAAACAAVILLKLPRAKVLIGNNCLKMLRFFIGKRLHIKLSKSKSGEWLGNYRVKQMHRIESGVS